MPKYGMVIDLQKCVGCGACAVGCKTENNTQNRINGQTMNWSDFYVKQEGRFPNVVATTLPVLCNHCSDAACVKACPVSPKAIYKREENGISIHNDHRCIGCRMCQEACPYSSMDVDAEQAQYSVLSFNEFDEDRHPAYTDATELIKECTASGAETAKKGGDLPPYHTRYKHPDYESVRRAGITEKCMFCEHRVVNGLKPYCTTVCPSQGRVFGDLNDPNSEVSRLLKLYPAQRLKNNKGEFLKAGEKGTDPNVYYIRGYSKRKV
jgi:Fe-S-cluster-containing dehydrogenase component